VFPTVAANAQTGAQNGSARAIPVAGRTGQRPPGGTRRTNTDVTSRNTADVVTTRITSKIMSPNEDESRMARGRRYRRVVGQAPRELV